MPETEQDGTRIQPGEGNGTSMDVDAEARMSITEDTRAVAQSSVSKEVQDESTTATRAAGNRILGNESSANELLKCKVGPESTVTLAESLVESAPHEDVKLAKAAAPSVELSDEVAPDAKKCKLTPTTATKKECVQQSTTNEATDKSSVDAQATTEPASLSDVRKALEEIQASGSICIGGKASSMPSLPGLHIQGIGLVPLPLPDHFAPLIKSVATQAPHGQGVETVVDITVRNTLQIDPTLVSLQNPAWEPELLKLLEKVGNALGVDPSLVRADLSKLLLDPAGCLFKPHQDSQVANGMFATLVIQLPSQFSGGTVNVRHGDQHFTVSLGAGGDAAFACHYMAHFADCEHDVLPIVSGYRLVLVYSLYYLGQSRTHVPNSDGGNLSSCLKRLPPKDSMFILPLYHQYTFSSFVRLGVGALKGSDRAEQQALEFAAGEQWKMIVAEITRTDITYYDCEEGDIELTSDLFYADGSDAYNELKGLREILNFNSVDVGGMILASNDELDTTWGDGESEFEVAEDVWDVRFTTYRTFILIVFNENTLFEVLCAKSIYNALQKTEGDPIYVNRLFVFLKGSNLRFDSYVCLRLLSLTPFDSLPVEVAAERLELVLNCLEDVRRPKNKLGRVLVGLVDKYGWSSPILAPIRTLLEQKIRLFR